MTLFVEIVCAFFIVVGAVFLFVGSYGLAKLPGTMRRLHGPSKATTLGIGALLIASMIYFISMRGAIGIHELLITLFLFLTAPVSAQMIAKVHIFRRKEERAALPPAGSDAGWATLTEATDAKAPARK